MPFLVSVFLVPLASIFRLALLTIFFVPYTNAAISNGDYVDNRIGPGQTGICGFAARYQAWGGIGFELWRLWPISF